MHRPVRQQGLGLALTLALTLAVWLGPAPPGRAATLAPTRHLATGYWLVASDGGVFAFGDARYRGSTGGPHPLLVGPGPRRRLTTDRAASWPTSAVWWGTPAWSRRHNSVDTPPSTGST